MSAIVVTGASSGIGLESVRALLAQGFTVFAGVRPTSSTTELQAIAADNLHIIHIDLEDPASIAQAAEAISAQVGEQGLYGLFNNAGIVVVGPMEYLPLERLKQQIQVNVLGQFQLTQALLPLLRKGQGRIVNGTSIGGRIVSPLMGAYGMSKFAMEAFTDALRLELEPAGIHVSALQFGVVVTPIWGKTQTSAEDSLKGLPQAHRDYYLPMIKNTLASTQISDRGLTAAQAAEIVVKAFTARRPKTRYLVGTDARIYMLLRLLLPDRMMDRVTRGLFNMASRVAAKRQAAPESQTRGG